MKDTLGYGDTYEGYAIIHEDPEDCTGKARILHERETEIEYVPFDGLGTGIEVVGINKGRIPQVRGRFHDPAEELEGDWLINVHEHSPVPIIVSSDNIKIG
jgi:hypothetical protein